MTTQRNAKPRVSQKLLAAAALATASAIAFVPAGQPPLLAHTQADAVSAADFSRSLAAR